MRPLYGFMKILLVDTDYLTWCALIAVQNFRESSIDTWYQTEFGMDLLVVRILEPMD